MAPSTSAAMAVIRTAQREEQKSLLVSEEVKVLDRITKEKPYTNFAETDNKKESSSWEVVKVEEETQATFVVIP